MHINGVHEIYLHDKKNKKRAVQKLEYKSSLMASLIVIIDGCDDFIELIKAVVHNKASQLAEIAVLDRKPAPQLMKLNSKENQPEL